VLDFDSVELRRVDLLDWEFVCARDELDFSKHLPGAPRAS